MMRALSEFGLGTLGITASDLQIPERVIQLGVEPNRIDVLTTISGVSFEDAWTARCEADLDGVATQFIGRNELIRNKESTGRPRDLGDADELRKRPHPADG